MGAPSVAEWARANPAGRDALLALTERAVALQPAAEAAIRLALGEMPTRDYLAEELDDLQAEVRRLRSRLEPGGD